MMKMRHALALVSSLALLVGCERTKSVPVTESTLPAAGVTPQAPPPATPPPWDAEIGPVLLVGGDSPETASVLSPDTAADTSGKMAGTRVMLLGRGGETQTASLQHLAPVAEGGCTGLASWTLSAPGTALAPWAFGVVATEHAKTIAMDSVESFSQADSANLAAQAARLASALGREAANRFSGLPYTVHSLWRFTIPPNTHVLAANLIRRLNQEASPLEERTLLIAESDSARGGYATAYSERSQGAEETVESRDFVAAAQLGADAHPIIVVARDYDDAVAYSLLEREGPSRWRLRWTSRRVRCAAH